MSVANLSSSHLSEYHHQVQQYIRKRKRMESELQEGPSEIVRNLVKNIKLNELDANDGESKEKKFSNDMVDACRTLCKVCQQPITLNYLRTHSKNTHKLSISKYKEMFGNHRDENQILQVMYHKCGICEEEMLLDADNIHLHVKRYHKIELSEYNAKFIKSSRSRTRITKKSKNNSEKDGSVLQNMINQSFGINAYAGLDLTEELDNLFDTL